MARKTKTPPPPYEAAWDKINALEAAVVYRTVTIDFTAADLIDWLYPAEVVRVLRAAHPYADLYEGHADTAEGIAPCRLIVYHARCGIVPPNVPAEPQDTPAAGRIVRALGEIVDIKRRHDIVRDVVAAFNAYEVTPAAAKYYFPALGALLPAQHAFHKVDGKTYREPYLSNTIIEKLREAPAIIASGLLCDPANHNIKHGPAAAKARVGDGQYFTLLTA